MKKKIIIIGSPGAGKSYLSRKLATLTGLPLVHLDKIYHDTNYDYLHDKEAWVRKVGELTGKSQWIIEGNYGSTMYDRMKAAEQIIYLDYPTYTSVSRVLKRRVQYRNKKREEMPADWKEKIDPTFMKFVVTFRKQQRPRVMKYLGQLEGKDIVILRNARETNKFLSSLGHSEK